MGMAASQARFLGLTARMNNIEYEGQQINQQRTALANKSASYYTDLLGMEVPTAPSVEAFTKTVYSFNDGALTNQITTLIADPAHSGKYKVSYIRSWTDDFSIVSATPSIITRVKNDDSTYTYKIGASELRELGKINAETVIKDKITLNGKTYDVSHEADGHYIDKETMEYKWKAYSGTVDKDKLEYFLFTSSDYKSAQRVYPKEGGKYVTKDEEGTEKEVTVNPDLLVMCLFDEESEDINQATTILREKSDGSYESLEGETKVKKTKLTDKEVASITVNSVKDDPYLKELSSDQLKAIIEEEKLMLAKLNDELNNGDQTGKWRVRYVQNTSTGEFEGVYYKDSDISGDSTVYDSNDHSQSFVGAYKLGSAEKVEEVKGVEGVDLEQDSTGRYIKITIDGKDYALSTTTVTDQDAYEDAMNQYEYDKALYDQSIEEINAKIEIVQSEDKNLELRLKQLDTEHNAVSNEKDAVSKVIEKAVESGFKTFG